MNGLALALTPGWILGGGGGPAMPSGALGIYYIGDYDSDLVAIPNAASVEPLSENMLRWPKRSWSTPSVWATNGVTASIVNDSSSNPRARRITSAGAQFARLVTQDDYTIPAAATRTLVVKCKSAVAGVPQDVPIGGYFPIGTSVQSVGDSWTRLAYTFTNGGGSASYAVGICDMAGGNAFSIDVESIEMFEGSTDPGDDGDPGHLYMGKIGFTPAAVTVAAGSLTYASNQLGFVTFPGDTQSPDVTYFAVMRRPSGVTGTDKHGVIFETLNDFDVFPHYENAGVPSYTDGLNFTSSGGADPERGWDFIAMGWQCIAIRMTATAATLFLNGRPVSKKLISLGSFDINTLLHGSYFGGPAGFNHSATAIYASALSDSDIATGSQVLTARSVTDGITMGTPPALIVMEGDSKVAEDSYDYGWKIQPLLSSLSVVTVYASGGSTLSGSLEPRKQYVTALYSENNPFVFCVDIGTNDLHSGISAATFIADYKSYLSSIKTAVPNIKIVVIPLLSKSTVVGGFTEDTAFTTKRNTLNADMATWVGDGYCDAVLDLSGKDYFADDACTNAALLEDGWHHSAATSLDIAIELAITIDGL